MYEKRKIVVVENGRRKSKYDDVAAESGLRIFVNGKEFITLLCSPENLDYLARGIIFTSGLTGEKNRVRSFSIKGNYCYVETEKTIAPYGKIVSSGCGRISHIAGVRKSKPDNFRVSAERILFLMKEFQKLAVVYKLTGGVHCVGISDGEKIIFFHEDIGRHNAFDKVIGECLAKGVSTSKKIILSSGRISSEIVLKSAAAKIPVVVSKAAPTTYAIALAKLYSITIAGFVRGSRMNIYTHAGRII